MLSESLARPVGSPFVFIRAGLRFSAFFVIVTVFILHHEVMRLIIRDEEKRLKYFMKSVAVHTRIGLWLFNIDVDYDCPETLPAGLIVSNHLSYLDVLILFSRYPALFITSKEIGDVFLLGRLTKLAGCFHIERRKALRTDSMIQDELLSMKQKLRQGMSLFLFPEGTSSDGRTVLPFKAHFFQTAIDLDMPVTSLCLTYDWDNRQPEEICWYGDMGFVGHLLGVCLRPGIRARVTQLPYKKNLLHTRHDIANDIHDKTREWYEKH